MDWVWIGGVLKGCRTSEWVGFGLEGSLRVAESWNGFEFGLEGFLRVVEPQNGLGLGWTVLKGCRTPEWV